jgi:predicted dienelactone hydrolase
LNAIKTALAKVVIAASRTLSGRFWDYLPTCLPYASKGDYQVQAVDVAFACPRRPKRTLRARIWYPVSRHQHRLPLMLYSHYLTGWRTAPPFICEHLASHGFVTAAVDHEDPYPDWPVLVDRPLDMLALLNWLSVDREWNTKLDFERIGAAGYSMGGTTALMLGGARINPPYYLDWCGQPQPSTEEGRDMKRFTRWWDQLAAYRASFGSVEDMLWTSFTDSRIAAVLAMAPWGAPLFGEAGINCIQIPTCIIGGTNDKNAVYERDQVFIFNHLTSPEGTLVSIQDEGHQMVYAPGIQDVLNHYATAFFSYHLRQKLARLRCEPHRLTLPDLL